MDRILYRYIIQKYRYIQCNILIASSNLEYCFVFALFFFFSSRRRHTRLTCDWSSDVCSSDLGLGVDGLSLGQAVAAYLFSLAFGLIFPLPVDIGVNEASGVAALLAMGIGKSDEIGRASCRERVESSGVAVSWRAKPNKSTST